MDASLKQLLTKNLELHKILDVEVKASGKLQLLDEMLTHIKKNGLKAVVFYQVHFYYLRMWIALCLSWLCHFVHSQYIYMHLLLDNVICLVLKFEWGESMLFII